VDGLTFAIEAGRTLGVVGESGCGKSTTAKLVLRLEEPTDGVIRFEGQDLRTLDAAGLRRYRASVQAVFQDPYASLNPRMRVGAIIAEPLVENERASASEVRRRVARLLDLVGLPERSADLFPHEFSGGQRQRIAIARALSVHPRLVVCDEPTSALDVSVQAQILNLLKRLQRELGVAYLFITHNLGVVSYVADEVAVMYLGRIVEHGGVEEVLADPKHPYTRALLDAVPTLEGGREQLHVKGELPSPVAPPAGCHFHPRCPHATAQCRTAYPAELALSTTRRVNCWLYGEDASAPSSRPPHAQGWRYR
jgi:oligopeptide/dipeptide ABC transporter ATP-binding protein